MRKFKVQRARPLVLSSCLILCVVAGILGDVKDAHAVFTLSVSPRRGGNDIRFEPARHGREVRNEEVTVTATTDEGQQYVVYMHLLSPLRNQRGDVLSPDAIKVFSPTSVSGTLDIAFARRLNFGRQRLYTSDSGGTQQAFNLVFNLQPGEQDKGGLYQGQLRFELIATGGGQSVQTVIRNIYVDLSADSKMIVRNVSGKSAVNFGRISERRTFGQDALEIDVQSNVGVPYRIYQQVTRVLSSNTGRALGLDDAKFEVLSSSPGSVESGFRSLSPSKQLIYESDRHGAPAVIRLNYVTEDVTDQMAGQYAGSLTFTMESNSALSHVAPVTFPMNLEIDTILFIDIETEGGVAMRFGKLDKAGDSHTQQVKIKTHNNTGERYRVSHVVKRPFTNERGDVIEGSYFTAVTSGETSGELQYPTETPVAIGESTLYISDTKGSESSFDVSYKLTLPQDTRGGNYTSDITFSYSII